jgi:CHAD domain-containing protein
VRSEIGDDVYRLENACYRDAAKKLASAREAAVLLETFDDLVRHHAEQIAPEAFADIRRQLRDNQPITELGDSRELAIALLHDARERPLHWPLAAEGFKLLARGLTGTYRRARRAFDRAYDGPANDVFHEWRKRTKDHWYHVRLLAPSWPGPLGALASELHRLSELLGDEHDLADLEAALDAIPGEELQSALGVLRALLVRRREQLRHQAQLLGERVFAERPERMERRFRAYFRAWQRELSRPAPSSRAAVGVDEADDAIDDSRVAQDAHVT